MGYRSPLPGGGRASLLAADLCVGMPDIVCVCVRSLAYVAMFISRACSVVGFEVLLVLSGGGGLHMLSQWLELSGVRSSGRGGGVVSLDSSA